MNFNVGDQFVEFYDGDPEGYSYTVVEVFEDTRTFYANSTHASGTHLFFEDDNDRLVVPCADCEGVCLTFYANEKVYKCEECGNEWD